MAYGYAETQLAGLGERAQRSAYEPLQEILAQLTGALTTGSMQARQPIYQQAVEESQLAASKAKTGTTEELARTGLVGTPFGQNILAEQDITSGMELARIPTEMAEADYWQLMQTLMPILLQLMGIPVEAYGTLVGAETQKDVAEAGQESTSRKAADILGSIGSIIPF